MIDEGQRGGGDGRKGAPAKATPLAAIDRASESVVGASDPEAGSPRAARAKQTSAIESGEIEIPPGSFTPPSAAASSGSAPPSSSFDPPPSTIIANAMGRGKTKLSIGAIVGIGCAIFVLLVVLTLLLFR